MIEDIQIEQHSFADDGDEEDLFELTHLTQEDIEELNSHITLSAVAVTDRFRRLQKELKRFLYALDRPMAS